MLSPLKSFESGVSKLITFSENPRIGGILSYKVSHKEKSSVSDQFSSKFTLSLEANFARRKSKTAPGSFQLSSLALSFSDLRVEPWLSSKGKPSFGSRGICWFSSHKSCL